MPSNAKTTYKLALITGASSGLGKELARRLARRGTALLLTGRSAKELAFLTAELRLLVPVEWMVCDLARSPAAVLALIQERVPDLIINNAGFTVYGDCLDAFSAQQEIFAVNATAAHAIALEAARTLHLHQQTGTILNIASAAACVSFPGMATYAASKAFLVSFTQSFDAELRPLGIRILASLPGQIATPFAVRAADNPSLSKTGYSMPVSKAATLILEQLDAGKTISIIDWRTRLSIFFSRWIPRAWLEKKLRANILKRTVKNR